MCKRYIEAFKQELEDVKKMNQDIQIDAHSSVWEAERVLSRYSKYMCQISVTKLEHYIEQRKNKYTTRKGVDNLIDTMLDLVLKM